MLFLRSFNSLTGTVKYSMIKEDDDDDNDDDDDVDDGDDSDDDDIQMSSSNLATANRRDSTCFLGTFSHCPESFNTWKLTIESRFKMQCKTSKTVLKAFWCLSKGSPPGPNPLFFLLQHFPNLRVGV